MDIKQALADVRVKLGGTHEERVSHNILAQLNATFTRTEEEQEIEDEKWADYYRDAKRGII